MRTTNNTKKRNIKTSDKQKKEKVALKPVYLVDRLGEEYKENVRKIYKSADEIKLTLKTREDVKNLRDKILEDRKKPILRDSPEFEAIDARRKRGKMLISNYNHNIERWIQRFNKLVADNNVFPDTISMLQEEINDGYASDLNIERGENFNDLLQLEKDINNVKYTEYFDLKKFMVDQNKYSIKRIFNKYFNLFKKMSSDDEELLVLERPVLAKNINNLRRFDRFINKELVITNESIEYLDLVDVQDNWALVFNPKIVLYKIKLVNDQLVYTCTKQSINCFENYSDGRDWWGEEVNDNTYAYITRN